jgi:uncharacterized membrane protein
MLKKTYKFYFALTVIIAITGYAYSYREIVDLGTLPKYPTSIAASINNSGQVVGWTEISNNSQYRACFFDTSGNGDNTYLGSLGRSWGMAGSINDNGLIVGVAQNQYSDLKACIFDSSGSGNNINLGGLGSFSQSSAFSINNNNKIVGWATKNFFRACLFDSSGAGSNIDLGTLGGFESTATSINDSDMIVGWAENSNNYRRACIFDITGTGNNIDLGALGGNTSSAWSVNLAGLIVGDSEDNSGNQTACLFDATGAGNNINLGTLGGDESYAFGINIKSQIVGWAYTDLGDRHACLYDITGAGNNIDLNTLIDPSLGWTLTGAFSINDNGWIVGQSVNADGEIHAYLLVPEPGTLLLLGAGSLLLRRRGSF